MRLDYVLKRGNNDLGLTVDIVGRAWIIIQPTVLFAFFP